MRWIFVLCLSLIGPQLVAQVVLLGENPPHGNVNDGDFGAVWDYWRNASQSLFWTTKIVAGDAPMGLHYGTLFSSNEIGVADSKKLDMHPDYRQPQAGDTLLWSFGADLEYRSEGSISLSFVFGSHERKLADRMSLVGGDQAVEHFHGAYQLTEADARAGHPFVRVTFYSERDVKVYLHYVNVQVVDASRAGPLLVGRSNSGGNLLRWQDEVALPGSSFRLYRQQENENKYTLLQETTLRHYQDENIVSGLDYQYLVTRVEEQESGASNQVVLSNSDVTPPAPPEKLTATTFATAVQLTWLPGHEADVDGYNIYRGNEQGDHRKMIGHAITGTQFEDVLAPKEQTSTYWVHTLDYSGNESLPSNPIRARVKAMSGASFSDLLRPIPIHDTLGLATWGAEGVRRREITNGVEDPDWSYWGGRPIKGKDGRFHMLVARWPENGLKGHWEWPKSTVAHTVATQPTGPYRVVKDTAYAYRGGAGHNPDIIKLNDGRFALYVLIDWEPTIFTATTMSGPWVREGKLLIDPSTINPNDDRHYQYTRNLSGVQLKDGRILMVSKFGCMMISDKGLLGPYRIITPTINQNTTIPKRYRLSNYEDPVMWQDEVQFHLLINAFLDYRAIYLRSPDGINWTYDPGLAYTPDFTRYEDGTVSSWHKLERPHVLQDEYGRATHLSVAVIDVPKKADYGNDEHNSKNLIIPLTVPRRLALLVPETINAATTKIQLLIHSEPGFDALTDVDRESLRFGAPSVVNLGEGCQPLTAIARGEDLLVTFSAEGNGFQATDYVGKLLGKTDKGGVLLGYVRLEQD